MAFVRRRHGKTALVGGDKQHRIRNGAVDQFDQSRCLGTGTEGAADNGDLKIFTGIVGKSWNADGGRLAGGEPLQFVDPVLNGTLVGGGPRTLLD